ncbi:sensor histidine kinase [Nocardiopsis sp. CT-R113]|uniref:Sensor histidine kinase n=1 Tax=Nocardiopsis codii TaxID=3065942 RepID=A0ABU7K7U9_9ACTN|nr:sensor histidine kinase [Nocardiopsis sp. CT-R113]MEE2038311.1 sensor histidine kinase [Nocardiopsis sp. CT-R113]
MEDAEGRVSAVAEQVTDRQVVGGTVDGGPADDGEPTGEEGLGDGAQRHAWDLGIWWDVYFTGTMAAIVLLALSTGAPGHRWLTAGLTAGTIVVYYLYGKRMVLLDGSDWDLPRSLTLSALLLLCILPAVILNPNLTFMLFAIAPLCFMTCGSGVAVPTVAVILLLPGLLRGLAGVDDWRGVLATSLVHAVLVGFSLWFGRWFELIIEQSYERSELITSLRESRSEAARLSEESGALAERERLAREMHDTLAQGFTSIVALTQAVESEMDTDPGTARRHLALMRETAAENLAEARAMVAARQPVPLDGEDLDAVLTRISARIGGELGITARSRVEGAPVPLSNDLKICLLRTAQEALSNVRKHSGARTVEVVLVYADTCVGLTVTDDGRGFVRGQAPTGDGLANMTHRARSVGGTLDVEGVPGTGTTVRMTLPLVEASASHPQHTTRHEPNEEPTP